MADAPGSALAANLSLRFTDASALAAALRNFSGDQGSGGLCIQVVKYYELGDRVRLTLEAGEAPMEIHAVVAWRKPGYIGVRFEPSSAAEGRVFASLRRLMSEAAKQQAAAQPAGPLTTATKPFAE